MYSTRILPSHVEIIFRDVLLIYLTLPDIWEYSWIKHHLRRGQPFQHTFFWKIPYVADVTAARRAFKNQEPMAFRFDSYVFYWVIFESGIFYTMYSSKLCNIKWAEAFSLFIKYRSSLKRSSQLGIQQRYDKIQQNVITAVYKRALKILLFSAKSVNQNL